MNSALGRQGEGKYGELLAPQDREQLTKLADELRRHETWKSNMTPGATGIEQGNVVNLLSGGINNPINKISMLKATLQKLTLGAYGKKQSLIDQAVMDPQKWHEMADLASKFKSLSSAELAALPMQQRLQIQALRAAVRTPGGAMSSSIGE